DRVLLSQVHVVFSRKRFRNASAGTTQPEGCRTARCDCRTLDSMEARRPYRWPPGLIDFRRDDWSVAARIVAKSGHNRTRTVPNSSGPGYQTLVRVHTRRSP